MEKQEAIDFVFGEIEKNRSEAEIVEELSSLLGAPQDIVKSFVSRTLASRSAIEPTSPAGEAPELAGETQPLLPEEPALDEVEGLGEQADTSQDYQEPAPASDSSLEEEQIAEEFLQLEDFQMEEEIELVEEPQMVENWQQIEDLQPAEDALLVEDLDLKEEDHANETVPPPAPDWDSGALSIKAAEPLSPEDQARLEKAILAALSKQRRQSDVVMMVCEKTGLSWDQGQRLVAEVSMKNRKSINRRQGLVQILLSLLAVLAGLALIFLVLSELYTFYRLYTQPEAMGSATSAVLDRYTISAGILGALLFLGGITGMVLGIRKRLD